MLNKRLLIITIFLFPIAVISFKFKKDETNFLLPENEEIEIKILHKNKIKKLKLEDYIVGVVAAEMPASFHEEALKAQAVASRSYALYKKNSSKGDYDLTSTTDNQVYIDKNEMREKWKDDYEKYHDKIKGAVKKTEGLVATSDNKIIKAFYFSMSNGTTQDSITVFKEDNSYLKSVESIYDNDSLRDFKHDYAYEFINFVNLLNLNCKTPSIGSIDKTANGYVKEITICSKKFTGPEFRKKLSIRSANFDIQIRDKIYITTYGYGHGVGMSQYGANGYAQNGYTYKEILMHYYNNIKIKSIKDV